MPRSRSGPTGKTNRSLTGAPSHHPIPAAPEFFQAEQRERYVRVMEQLGPRFHPGMEYLVESLVIALEFRDQLTARILAEGLLIGKGAAEVHPGEALLVRYEKRVSDLLRDLGMIRRERADRISDAKPASPEPRPRDLLAAELEEQTG